MDNFDHCIELQFRIKISAVERILLNMLMSLEGISEQDTSSVGNGR